MRNTIRLASGKARLAALLSDARSPLLRQVVYEGLRDDKPAAEARRSVPHPKPAVATSTAVRLRRPRA
jgi:hypothetical protein